MSTLTLSSPMLPHFLAGFVAHPGTGILHIPHGEPHQSTPLTQASAVPLLPHIISLIQDSKKFPPYMTPEAAPDWQLLRAPNLFSFENALTQQRVSFVFDSAFAERLCGSNKNLTISVGHQGVFAKAMMSQVVTFQGPMVTFYDLAYEYHGMTELRQRLGFSEDQTLWEISSLLFAHLGITIDKEKNAFSILGLEKERPFSTERSGIDASSKSWIQMVSEFEDGELQSYGDRIEAMKLLVTTDQSSSALFSGAMELWQLGASVAQRYSATRDRDLIITLKKAYRQFSERLYPAVSGEMN